MFYIAKSMPRSACHPYFLHPFFHATTFFHLPEISLCVATSLPLNHTIIEKQKAKKKYYIRKYRFNIQKVYSRMQSAALIISQTVCSFFFSISFCMIFRNNNHIDSEFVDDKLSCFVFFIFVFIL